jgi:hypothetical protein
LQALSNQEISKTNGEEGHKIRSTRCLSFRKNDVKIKQEEKLTHEVTQQKSTEAKNQKKMQIWKVFGPKGDGALLPREKSVIALCVGLQEALALW